MLCISSQLEQKGLLKILQLYSWIENKINTFVKRNTRKGQTSILDSDALPNAHRLPRPIATAWQICI